MTQRPLIIVVPAQDLREALLTDFLDQFPLKVQELMLKETEANRLLIFSDLPIDIIRSDITKRSVPVETFCSPGNFLMRNFL